jgi:D-amino peptidase
MKVYIMTDMEGISGIHNVEYTRPGSARYEEGRRLLTRDVNAAIAGCFDGGADEVYACDAHGGADHFLMEEIDPRAVVDHIAAGHWWGRLDETFGACMIVGAHAKAGTMNAFLDHTQSSESWYDFSINGKSVGETGQWACMAGAFDVPVVMLAGDKAACVEAKELLGDIETVAVKEAVGRSRAVCIAPEAARKMVRKAAARSLKLVKKIRPWRPKPPLELVLKLTRSDHADSVAYHPGTERVDARTIRRVVEGPLNIFDIF